MKKEILAALSVLAVVAAVFVIATMAIRSNNKFKVVHFAEEKSVVGADGRASVGSPEVYQINISPALAWKKMDSKVKAWRNIAIILLLVTAVYIGLSSTGQIQGSIHLAYVGLALSLASFFAAYSSAFVSNYKELNKEEYELIKDDQKAIEALFDKPLIK